MTSLLADEKLCLVNQWLCPIRWHKPEVNEYNDIPHSAWRRNICSQNRKLGNVFCVYLAYKDRQPEISIYRDRQIHWQELRTVTKTFGEKLYRALEYLYLTCILL